MAFSPTGDTLATGSFDETVILWDVTDPAHPTGLGSPLSSNDLSPMSSVTFFPDGNTLTAGHFNGTVALWDLTDLYRVRNHAVQLACAVTHGGLTRDEWGRFVPELTYQDTCTTGELR